ncbi:MAG TPA: phosphatidate cytidylyltransferase, partial [Chthoniobacterales bacterium]|nr:phosphatidate cytidylyltransferase [Chthoniobacterales bacterium]
MTANRLTFFMRLGSTVTLWAIILASIFSGREWAFFCVIAFMPLVALWEYFRMLDKDGIPNFQLTAMICATVFFAGSFYLSSVKGSAHVLDFELAILVLFLIVMFARQMFASIRDREPLQTLAYTLFGLFWIAWMFSFVTKILFLPPRSVAGDPTGQFYVLFLVAVTKFSDMGAYVFGSLFGKHAFVPHISPKKTWEGFAGALFASLLAAFGLHWLIPTKLSAFSNVDLAVLGLVLGFAAVIGDLAESIVKRSTQNKDSGAALPGIGGTLDLIDSLLFTAPLLYFYMRFV